MAVPLSTSSSGIKTCSGNHKTRLLIGEGNFSYALAHIEKHDKKAIHSPEKSIGHAIIATEYKKSYLCSACDLTSSFKEMNVSSPGKKSEDDELCSTCKATAERIERLKILGVQIEWGIDGTKIHENATFKNKTFSRIHWNCPHDGSNFKDQTLPKILEAFFKSCKELQTDGDRVHLTLAQPNDKKNFYQGFVYNLVRAAAASGYQLFKKRTFDDKRYPGYQHTQTAKNEKASVTDQGLREFVFKKVPSEFFKEALASSRNKEGKIPVVQLANYIQQTSPKKCTIAPNTFYKEERVVYYCSSDEDSSDGEI